MKIISQFKDYYDWISGKYGGGDPKLPYVRNRIKGGPTKLFKWETLGQTYTFGKVNTERVKQKLPEYKFEMLIFCGKQFLIVKDQKGPNILDKDRHPDLWAKLESDSKRRYYFHHPVDLGFYIGRETEDAIDLCKEYNQPVLRIHSVLGPKVDDNIPVLQDLGFASIMSPEQCYQELSQFLGNVLRESPDSKPPVEVEDKFKIVGAGFDLKQSFRHRK